MENVLLINFYSTDLHRDMTIREFLIYLLSTLWKEEEGFSGKRPFGNSGWKGDIEVALIREGLVKGKLDADGYIEEIDQTTSDALILNVIQLLK